MYQVDVLIQGFLGRAVCHGGLGWSTITLLRGEDRVILLDVGAFGVRAQDVTDVVLTHAHYDHAVNFTLFPNATVWIGDADLTMVLDASCEPQHIGQREASIAA